MLALLEDREDKAEMKRTIKVKTPPKHDYVKIEGKDV